MEDKHKYYPNPGWYWKWWWALIVFIVGILLLIIDYSEKVILP